MKKESRVFDFYGNLHAPKVGAYILLDGWRPFDCLTKGDDFSTFRIPLNSQGPIKDIAIEVEVTGKVARRFEGCYWARCAVTYPHDGGPDSYSGGFLLLDDRSKV